VLTGEPDKLADAIVDGLECFLEDETP
jgi:hypothetical protein